MAKFPAAGRTAVYSLLILAGHQVHCMVVCMLDSSTSENCCAEMLCLLSLTDVGGLSGTEASGDQIKLLRGY
jgi:hypothetical protein